MQWGVDACGDLPEGVGDEGPRAPLARPLVSRAVSWGGRGREVVHSRLERSAFRVGGPGGDGGEATESTARVGAHRGDWYRNPLQLYT